MKLTSVLASAPRDTEEGHYACSPFGEHRTLAAYPGCWADILRSRTVPIGFVMALLLLAVARADAQVDVCAQDPWYRPVTKNVLLGCLHQHQEFLPEVFVVARPQLATARAMLSDKAAVPLSAKEAEDLTLGPLPPAGARLFLIRGVSTSSERRRLDVSYCGGGRALVEDRGARADKAVVSQVPMVITFRGDLVEVYTRCYGAK